MNIPLCERSTASATRNSSTVANCKRTNPATLMRGARAPAARLNTARLMDCPPAAGRNGSSRCEERKETAGCRQVTSEDKPPLVSVAFQGEFRSQARRPGQPERADADGFDGSSAMKATG